MKVFMIGGTGLLGSEAAKVLISRGHEVTAMALPPLPEGAVLPPEMKIEYGNYLEMSDDELRKHLTGCDGFVFAAGVDERVEGPAPIYNLYKKYNIDPINRLLKLAKECGVKHVSICGSYFSYFAKTMPELELTRWHPYIRSRVDQENAAMSFADENFSVAVLELPYIFGTQPGRKPVWMFLAEQIRNSKGNVMCPKGGSTIAHCRKMRRFLLQRIAQEPAVTNVCADLIRRPPQGRQAVQMLDQDHLEQHHRIDAGPPVIFAIERLHHFIQRIEINRCIYFSKQLLRRYQLVYYYKLHSVTVHFSSFQHLFITRFYFTISL